LCSIKTVSEIDTLSSKPSARELSI
jgi:hypothetical protein